MARTRSVGASNQSAASAKTDRGERLPVYRHEVERAHKNTVVVALANKLARIAWAVLTGGQGFDAAHPVAA